MQQHVNSESQAPGPNDGPEVDAWWGAYSSWTLMPSLCTCALLTFAIIWAAGFLVERRHVQWTIWGLAGCVWLVQLIRWSSRVFGRNYRLSTRRLLAMHGHIRPWRSELKLNAIADVSTQFRWPTRWFDVGSIIVTCDDGRKLVLEGVHQPAVVAERIRKMAERARARTSAPAAELPVSVSSS